MTLPEVVRFPPAGYPEYTLVANTGEDGERWSVLGTTVPRDAHRALVMWSAECGFLPGDEEWFNELNDPESFKDAQVLWTRPPAELETDYYDHIAAWRPGLIPWMSGECTYGEA